MRAKLQRKLCTILSALALSACSTIPLPRTPMCVPSGKVSLGAECAMTYGDETYSLTFEEFIDFLEAQPERPDPKNPGKVLPAHGSALCLSSDGFSDFRTALDQACAKLGGRVCTVQVQQEIAKLSQRVERLQLHSLVGKKGQP